MFDSALQIILHSEGGYVNNPVDRGGPTNYGITQSTYDRFKKRLKEPTRPVRECTPEEVRKIYFSEYWTASGANLIATFDYNLAVLHFDFAVNSGVRTAIRALQRLVGTEADGRFGPITLARVKSEKAFNLYQRYTAKRLTFFTDIVRKDKSQLVFLAGWVNRIADLLNRAEA